MEPHIPDAEYDNVAQWWHDQHHNSQDGVAAFDTASGLCPAGDRALADYPQRHVYVSAARF
ncbi:MAG: hypothetical protein NWR61_02700 [Pseudomonadales bacterium]|jgi:hypothetical protein|nr:hypothetical protein [Pseudomonadales bacterium]MDP4639916.1 hypothetical protein [Pseudomonadales bacterium]MDP4765235.1 hypothetical protein [Pseudomonadales bacterium]MDP4874816.1 hypothetical protein [Pseudomonadales bacterium]MDP4911827.1 hypothetical protein [Pseudomonadales bacterium]